MENKEQLSCLEMLEKVSPSKLLDRWSQSILVAFTHVPTLPLFLLLSWKPPPSDAKQMRHRPDKVAESLDLKM